MRKEPIVSELTNQQLDALHVSPEWTTDTLESIRALAIRSHADSVVEMTTAFGTFLRGSLNYGRHYT